MKRIQKSFLLLIFLSSLQLLSIRPIYAKILGNGGVIDTVKILTIGNSFADNACRFLDKITQSVDGCFIIIGKANLGGCSLERHASLIEQCKQDPSKKPYSGKSLKDILQSEDWDAVTIQQVSSSSFRPESFQPYADQICEYIKKYSPQSQIYIHETWPYAPDCPRLEQFELSHKKMYKKLRKNYITLSKRYDAPILGSGDAFYYSHKKNNCINLWSEKDRYHASPEGCYLAGCVWFSKLFEKDPEAVTFVPEGMEKETATFLRKVAAK